MDKPYACLWFDDRAEEAARFYASVFPHSRVGAIARYGDEVSKAAGRPKGSVMTAELEIDGQRFLLLNGGPMFTFSEAVSFVVPCKDQRELDDLWAKLTAGGGQEGQCGWMKDKFGLSWQLIPKSLPDMMKDKDPKKSERALASIMPMRKIDIAAVERAYEGR